MGMGTGCQREYVYFPVTLQWKEGEVGSGKCGKSGCEVEATVENNYSFVRS